MEKEENVKEILDAIEKRHAVRKFDDKKLEPNLILKLQEYINRLNVEGDINMQFILDNAKGFSSFDKTYGNFEGVNNYVCMIANKNDQNAAEKLGYYGGLFMLHAVSMGLGTCWVGGSFNKKRPYLLNDNDKFVCLMVIGNLKDGHEPTKRRTKSEEQLYESHEEVPVWFLQGIRAVQKAPSALNRQKIKFYYKNGEVSCSTEETQAHLIGIDLGVAKLYFELGAGGGRWQLGNDARFVHETQAVVLH